MSGGIYEVQLLVLVEPVEQLRGKVRQQDACACHSQYRPTDPLHDVPALTMLSHVSNAISFKP